MKRYRVVLYFCRTCEGLDALEPADAAWRATFRGMFRDTFRGMFRDCECDDDVRGAAGDDDDDEAV